MGFFMTTYCIALAYVFFIYVTYPRGSNQRPNWMIGLGIAVVWPGAAAYVLVFRVLPWALMRFYIDARALLPKAQSETKTIQSPTTDRLQYKTGQWAE